MMSTIDSGHLANTPPDRQCRHTGRLQLLLGLAQWSLIGVETLGACQARQQERNKRQWGQVASSTTTQEPR